MGKKNESSNTETKNLLKIAVIGLPASGRTSLVRRFVDKRFDETPEPYMDSKVVTNLTHASNKFEITFQDPTNSEIANATATTFHAIQCCVIVVDMTMKLNNSDFVNMKNGVGRFSDVENIVWIIVGNKCDLQSEVTDEQFNDLLVAVEAKKSFKVSCKTGDGVDDALNGILDETLKQFPIVSQNKPKKEKKSGGCIMF